MNEQRSIPTNRELWVFVGKAIVGAVLLWAGVVVGLSGVLG
jgi:hypothetical protein